jgi:hypothetical protein
MVDLLWMVTWERWISISFMVLSWKHTTELKKKKIPVMTANFPAKIRTRHQTTLGKWSATEAHLISKMFRYLGFVLKWRSRHCEVVHVVSCQRAAEETKLTVAWFDRMVLQATHTLFVTLIIVIVVRVPSWLQIQRSGFHSRRYQIFWEVALEGGPLSLVSTTEELLGRKSSYSGLENQGYCHRGSAALTTRYTSISKSWH